jgi:hypothetical protein
MSRPSHLKEAPPPVTDERCWRRVLNFMYLYEQDSLFVWLRSGRRVVEEEAEKREAA